MTDQRYLSIPQWCDCCADGNTRNRLPSLIFQSHNGAIAARRTTLLCRDADTLSIPQWCDCCEGIFAENFSVHRSFNPTMVRLLLNITVKYRSGSHFQSHNGAIAACSSQLISGSSSSLSIPQWCDCCVTQTPPSPSRWRFQSHNGAIAALRLGAVSGLRELSIPQWCDCCDDRLRNFMEPSAFNPTMVRLLHLLKVRYISVKLSIPQWCDCCVKIGRAIECGACNFQSHNGAIAAGNPLLRKPTLWLLSIP